MADASRGTCDSPTLAASPCVDTSRSRCRWQERLCLVLVHLIYALHSRYLFLSPVANWKLDAFAGNFNRNLLIEVIHPARALSDDVWKPPIQHAATETVCHHQRLECWHEIKFETIFLFHNTLHQGLRQFLCERFCRGRIMTCDELSIYDNVSLQLYNPCQPITFEDIWYECAPPSSLILSSTRKGAYWLLSSM